MNDKKLIIPADKIGMLLEKCASMKSITVEQMALKSRKREIVEARQWAMYFLKSYTKMSLQAIGNMLGQKDHATTHHACEVVCDLIESDKSYKAEVDKIEAFVIDLCKPEPVAPPEPAKEIPAPVILDEETENFKKLAEERLVKINHLKIRMSEYDKIIQELRSELKIAEGQARLFKRKLEYASIPGRILVGE